MIIGLIPARSGSKGIPQKNIKKLGGYPLLAWSIAALRMCKLVPFVSTDSEEFACIAKSYNAYSLLRPTNISGDTSTDKEYVDHALTFLPHSYELLVLLRPTTPLRDPAIIDLAIETMLHNPDYTSLRSIHEDSETAYKHMELKNGDVTPIFEVSLYRNKYDLHTTPRQLLPKTYTCNGYVDIIKPPIGETLYGNKVFGFISPNAGELDSLDDWDFVEWKLQREGNPVYDYLRKTYPL